MKLKFGQFVIVDVGFLNFRTAFIESQKHEALSTPIPFGYKFYRNVLFQQLQRIEKASMFVAYMKQAHQK